MCPFSILAFLQPTTVDKEPYYSGIPATDSMELKKQLHEHDCHSILAWCNQHHARF